MVKLSKLYETEEIFLPTAYVVRREVMFSLCPSLGGWEGYPGQVQVGGQVQTGRGVPQPGPDGGGGTWADLDGGGYPGQVQMGVP